MSQSEKIIAAAQAIRPELPRLLPAEAANRCADELATLLTQIANNQAQPTQLTALLTQHPNTRDWLRRYLRGESPSDILKGMPRTTENQAPVPATDTYICPTPDCPKTWTRRSSGQTTPDCPDHNVPFIPAP